MISSGDIDNLAALARLAVPEEAKAKLAQDLESILGYVSELKNAPKTEASAEVDAYLPINVLRADTDVYPTAAAGEHLKVKKIL